MPEGVRHYLLRLWREEREGDEEEGGHWRASLRCVQDGSLMTFSDPDALMRFLGEERTTEGRRSPT